MGWKWRPQWTLRSMLAGTAVFATFLGAASWELQRNKKLWMKEKQIAGKIEEAGGDVYFDWYMGAGPVRRIHWLERRPFRWFVDTKYFGRATMVNLCACDVSGDELCSLSLGHLEHVWVLRLYGCRRVGDEIGPTLGKLKRLQKLTLSHTGITDYTIGCLHALPDLMELDVRGANVSTSAVDALPQRRWLRVTGLGTSGVEYAPPMSNWLPRAQKGERTE